MTIEQLNGLTGRVLECAYEVHTILGPGLQESAYQACLLYELAKRGIPAEAQVPLPVVYDGQSWQM